MKKIFFITLAFIAFTPVFSQSNLEINICGNTNNTIVKEKINEKTISQSALLKCTELVVNDTNWKVNFFIFSFVSTKEGEEDTVFELNMKGNRLSERMTMVIKKYNPKKIYIENIEIVNTKNEFGTGKPLILIIED
ncbi:MAG: hypothetical protein COA97_11960 [Flavobacteriales bacterium]|nr:MAG: hypothetical protein COA97_11960 [Flavobacteriales bacterium]